jgi:hypothetical protein
VTVRRNRSTENLIGVVEVSAPPISVCKDLHREEVLGRRNAKRSGATNVDLGRSCDEFRLDTARRADQVDVDPGTSDESYCRCALRRLVLDQCRDAIARDAQVPAAISRNAA